jgi:hypothetical protein
MGMAKQKQWLAVKLFRSPDHRRGYETHGTWSGKRPIGPVPECVRREFKSEAGFRQWWSNQCSWGCAEIWNAAVEFGLFVSLSDMRIESKEV